MILMKRMSLKTRHKMSIAMKKYWAKKHRKRVSSKRKRKRCR